MMTPLLKRIMAMGIIAIILVLAGTIIFNIWFEDKMQKAAVGLADSIFPFHEYTEQELNQKYPQIRYADVPTRITPEQTYAKFRQALKENNLQMALDQLSKESENYSDNKEVLTQAFNDGKFTEAIENYPEITWWKGSGDSLGQLCYEQMHDTEKFVGCSSFIKSKNGDWLIDVL